MSCTKASKFLDARAIEVVEKVPASRKLGAAEARGLAREATRLVIAKGRKLDVFEPSGKPTRTMIEAMLGSTGNLRAPTLKVGETVLVGFDEKEYEAVLGARR